MSTSHPQNESSIQKRFWELQKAADRFRNFSPQTIRRLIKTSLALACLALFFKLGTSIQTGGLLPLAWQSIDDSIVSYIGTNLRSPQWDFLVMDLSSLGGLAVTVTICVVAAVLLILTRDPAAALHLGLVSYGGFKIAGWAKTLFDRPRPDLVPKLIQVGGMSFPSGHAVTASAVYLTLAILAARHFRTAASRATLFLLAGLLIFIVAFSRVYMGVHYPSDVLSGALLGSAWALFMGALFSRRVPHHR
jgi:undecaprenyl-diphosphatase